MALDTAADAKAEQARRLERLCAAEPQLRAAFPREAVSTAKRQPGLRLAQVVRIVMEGYADRPALGQRARELVSDPATGRKTLRLLPAFETITYRELWTRARAVAADWSHDRDRPLKAGDFACILGFASPDYAALLLASIHLGAVIAPLQTSAPASQHAAIIAETEPRILASGVDYLETAVEAVLAGFTPQRLVVFDYDARDDVQRDKVAAARRRLAERAIVVDTLPDLVAHAAALPEPPLYVPPADEDPLAWLFYTSGTTGTPKGAMFTQSLVVGTWLHDHPFPAITLSFMPMSHLVGNGYMLLALANGGTSYCSPKSDLSTLFEDLPLARPTMASLVPRVCEMLYHHYLREVDRRLAGGVEPAAAEAAVKTEMREKLLGGRLMSVGCGSAALSPEIYAFMESMLGMHMAIGYSSTEIAGGTVLVDGKVQRPPVIDYKLADVPELGYFRTDKPHPRGELLVKTNRFMGGYFKRPDLTAEKLDPEGYYRTGDVMAELGPDHLVYVDRCNNVQKLSQGEFVAIARLEALYSRSPVIRQIYIYGSSERSYLLAVVAPTEELAAKLGADGAGAEAVKAQIRRSLREIAEEHDLNGYEIPRDFLLETEPFSPENGLLTGIGKFSRPKFKERYGERLEQIYAQIAQDQVDELRALRSSGSDRPVLETVMRAAQAILGVSADVAAEAKFTDLGGDSLSALEYSILLDEIFAVEVPVGVIISPANDLQRLARHIEAERGSGARRPSFATVHGADAAEIRASELKLEKFLDAELLAKAPGLPQADGPVRTVLVTGATGYLGRFLALSWLERLATTGGKVVLIARGADAIQARQRIDAAFDTDPQLMAHYRALAAEHLEVLPGDLGLPDLGLDAESWRRLAESVDLIVHSGAHVNHVLPYNQLFAANVAGTAELIRLAITTRRKRFNYISTLGVSALARGLVDEDGDIRGLVPACELNDSYANGYNLSKWASEVLLREAAEACGLAVDAFRPGMILAHSRYAGQLNVPDMFTRLLYSLAVTGIAPATFYAEDLSRGRPAARYEGFAVDFLADVITAIGGERGEGFRNFNLSSPHDSGVSLDDFVDWMVEAGCAIERIDSYRAWLSRFETAMRTLPEDQRHLSILTLLGPYRSPQPAGGKSRLQVARFQAAAEAAGLPIPQLSAALIKKYVADLKHLQLLSENSSPGQARGRRLGSGGGRRGPQSRPSRSARMRSSWRRATLLECSSGTSSREIAT
jgi:fatty acid CoA ligase FadD9